MTADPPALHRAGFWFLRHGQTDWNRNNLAQGSIDVPLNSEGLEQAHAAAALLDGKGIASLVCSPLGRARTTAEIVAARLHLPVAIAPDLHEAAFGVMEGKPMLAQWFTDWIDGVATPPGAEPFQAVGHRAVAAVNRERAARPNPVLVVAHGAVFRALRAAMGLAPNERLGNGTPLYCDPGQNGGPWRLIPASPT